MEIIAYINEVVFDDITKIQMPFFWQMQLIIPNLIMHGDKNHTIPIKIIIPDKEK